MRLTLWTDYALRSLIYVGAKGGQFSTIAEIADSFGISKAHLMKIVNRLAQQGYLETVRGRKGGIRLRRSAADINLGALIRHTEKQFELVDCTTCLIAPACQVTDVFVQATGAFLAVLDQYTLADMMVQRNQLHRLFSAATAAAGTGTRS